MCLLNHHIAIHILAFSSFLVIILPCSLIMFVALFWFPSNFLIFLSDLKVSIPVLSLWGVVFCTGNQFFFRLYITYLSSFLLAKECDQCPCSQPGLWHCMSIILKLCVAFCYLTHFYSLNERWQCREPAGTRMPLGTDPSSESKEFLHWKNLMVRELSTVHM